MPSLLTPDSGLLFWMLLAFLTVFIILAKYGFPVIVKMVEERKQFIDDSLKSAREANEKLANIKLESEAILKEAREQQAQIIKDAMSTRDLLVQKAKEQAYIEGRKLLEEAKSQIVSEKEKALQEVRLQVVELSMLVATKILQKELDSPTNKQDLVNRYIDEITDDKTKL